MPTAVGPFSRRTRLACAAMTSNASSQEMGVNSPSLAYWPFRMRSSGVVSRSAPYMILDRK